MHQKLVPDPFLILGNNPQQPLDAGFPTGVTNMGGTSKFDGGGAQVKTQGSMGSLKCC